jgi:hypothetical protein
MAANLSGLKAKMARYRAQGPVGRQAAAADMMKVVMADIVRNVDKDTNRLVRAYMQAANDLGVGSYTLPPIKESAYAWLQKRRLDKQLREVRLLLETAKTQAAKAQHVYLVFYAERGRKLDKWGKMYRDRAAKATTRVQRIQKVVDRAQEQVTNFTGTEIIIGGRKVKLGKDPGVSALAQVRVPVYGGDGRWIQTPTASLARVHAKEPHATINERKNRAVATAIAKVRAGGLRRAGKVYLQKLGER